MATLKDSVGFHDLIVAAPWTVSPGVVGPSDTPTIGHWDTQFRYTFTNFFHPFVGELIARLNARWLPGVLDPVWQDSLKTADPGTDAAHDFFHLLYRPSSTKQVQVSSFPKEIDV